MVLLVVVTQSLLLGRWYTFAGVETDGEGAAPPWPRTDAAKQTASSKARHDFIMTPLTCES